jgi:hypothetical protein
MKAGHAAYPVFGWIANCVIAAICFNPLYFWVVEVCPIFQERTFPYLLAIACLQGQQE